MARFDPEYVPRIAAVRHGKDAGGISPEEHSRIEALAHSIWLTAVDALPLADGTGARPFPSPPMDAG
jgi:hypothetical protein